MQTPDLVLLYVKDIEKSMGFYRDLLKREPKAAFPTFAALGWRAESRWACGPPRR